MSLLAPTAPGPGRLALRMLLCRKLRVIRKHGGIPLPAPYVYRRRYRRCQGRDGTVGVERRGISCGLSCRDCKRRARVRPPWPIAATMSASATVQCARRMIDTRTATEPRSFPQRRWGYQHGSRRRCLGSMWKEQSSQYKKKSSHLRTPVKDCSKLT